MQKHAVVVTLLLLMCLPGCVLHKRDKKVETITFSSKTPDLDAQGKITRNTLFVDEDNENLVWEESEEANLFLSQTVTSENSAVAIRPTTEEVDPEGEAAHRFKIIYFDYDQYLIKADQIPALEENLRIIKRLVRRGKTVLIEGHACISAGSGEYNMMLSERRAEAVAKFLIEHGVPANRLKIVGRGNEMPLVVAARDVVSQAPNRRVEFYAL